MIGNDFIEKINARRLAEARAEIGPGAADMTDDDVWAWVDKRADEEARQGWARERLRRRDIAIRGVILRADIRRSLVRGEISGEAIDIVAAWVKSDRRVLFLAGPPGVGKTVAAAHALALEAFPHEYDFKADPRDFRTVDTEYVAARDLVRRAFAFKSERDEMPSLPRRGIVLLDDVGVQTDSRERFNAALTVLIDAAIDGDLRLVATTNLTPASLREVLDERVRDRLNDCGKLAVIKGASLRKQDGGFA